MTEYNFLADLLDTFQSMDNSLKALALLIPPTFLLGLLGLLLRHRAMIRAIDTGKLELDALPVRDIYDRVDRLQSTQLGFDEREELYAEPVTPVLRRD